jgi:sortase A
MYKFDFILSLFLVIVLSSLYIYAEYDRNKSEEVSQEILASMNVEQEDDTTVKSVNNVLVVALDDTTEEELEEITPAVNNASVQTPTTTPTEQVIPNTYQDEKGNTYATVGTIKIPKINVSYPILSETSDALLKVAPCKFWGPNPNEVGNLCIVGHNYRNNRFFSKVPTLTNGDTIEIMDLTGTTVTYEVYDNHVVDPTDVSDTTQKTNGKREITLITCTNDSKQRVVVKATAIE